MLIAVMSDSHNNRDSLSKAIDMINKRGCEVLIHCGDYTSPSSVTEFKSFHGMVYGVFGNMDRGIWPVKHLISEEVSNFSLFSMEGEVELEGKKIAFTHYPETARNMAKSGKYHVVFYGHTHKHHTDRESYKTPLINPGDIQGRYGKSSFIFYDLSTGEVEKIDL